MARLSTGGVSTPETAAVDLSRLLSRAQKTLLKPDTETEHRLRTSAYHRNKISANLEYARGLLLRLEQDSATIKVQSKKHDVQTGLLRQRDMLLKLSEHLDEFNNLQNDTDESLSEDEDLLGEDTPSENTDTPTSNTPTKPTTPTMAAPSTQPPPNERDLLFPSTLRARHIDATSAPQDSAISTSTSLNVLSTSEKLLTHNRTEQESLTSSLLSMAERLKESSKAFASSLEAEKETVNRAGEGLERNTAGMEAASRNISVLRRMSEGEGWWGRMMLYAWIFGLMLLALFIVGFMPKLRF